MEMGKIEKSVMVMPPVYEIQLGFWRWCKIGEVCAIVPDVARLVGVDFTPDPESLVALFADLVRPNRGPISVDEERNAKRKKIFRYSVDGTSFDGTEVLVSYPPRIDFKLKITTPYPLEMFVPEGWAIDVLKVIRRGFVRVMDWGEGGIVGFYPKPDPNGDRFGRHSGGAILLSKKQA